LIDKHIHMNYFLYIISFLSVIQAHSQNWIHPSLQSYLANNPQVDFVSVRIDFHNHFDSRAFHLKCQEENVSLTERVPLLIQSLQQRSAENQLLVKHFLLNHSQSVSYTKSFWIADVIFARVRPELISELIDVQGNFSVHLENNRFLLHDPIVESNEPQTKAIEGVEPGVLACNVRPLWDLGYTGRGRKVFIYDTGVWPDHPAFADRFLGHYTEMNSAWYGYYSPDPTGARNNHGTHVLGTTAGLSPFQNDTIGVAFNAYWMANDLIGHSTTVLPGLEDMMACFEWALNPDGDPFTVHDMPDVINNSWRWYDGADAEQCEGPVVQLMNAVEAAGIANVFSGGNFGPSNTNISAPQRINTSEVNTFSVGSVNGNSNFPHPISSFSSIGPKQCPGSGSLSIHPEVVAPGQNVRSAWKVNEYNSISGTSMASPHVSGVLLLLKEAFPYLTGEELLWALYLTAVDLGEPGEDNVYGMGLIDAHAAFTYLAQSHTPVLPESCQYDLSLEELILPFEGDITCQSSFIPELVVRNKGTQAVSNFTVQYGIPGQIIQTYTHSTSINPGESVSVNLPQVTTWTTGNVSLKAWVDYSEMANDCDQVNNVRYKRFNIRPQVELPFVEHFENGFSNGLWTILNPDKLLSWDTTNTVQKEFGHYSARIACFDYSPNQGQKDELITPFFTLNTEETATLRFDVAYLRRLQSLTIQDSLRIRVKSICMNDNGTPIAEFFGLSLASSEELFWNFSPDSGDQWSTKYVDLTPFQGETIAISFESVNKTGNNIYLDNVKIYQGQNEPLIISENKKTEPILYPNPNDGNFILELPAEWKWSTIQLYDLSGKTVYTHENVDNYLKINLEFLPKGLYFVEVKSGNEVFHLRTIKQ
jgi:subtilisin family serine protease